MIARWRGEERKISTRDQLLVLLTEIRTSCAPTLLQLEARRSTLGVGLGHPETIVLFQNHGEDEGFHSVGDLNRTDKLLFYGWSDLDEFPGTSAIAAAAGPAALLAFYDSGGEQPAGIEWESDF